MPNVLEWIGLESAGRLIWSTLLLIGGCVVAYVLTTRPKSPEQVTWAQAVLGAVAVYALMTLAYGTVPHEWLNYASAKLNWGEDTFFFRQGVIPFDMNRRAGADIGATIIYAVFLVTQVWLTVRWQKRPVAEVAESSTAATDEAGPSARKARRISMFGRPVTTRG